MGETEPERIDPLSLKDFKALPRVSAPDPERYRRLYLSLPQDLRVALRELSERAVKEGINQLGGKGGAKEAIIALRLTGSAAHKAILADRDVEWAIGIALDSAHYEVSKETEALLDVTHEQVNQVLALSPDDGPVRPSAIDSTEDQPRINLIELIKGVMGDFVGVTTPEEALEVSLRYAGYSLAPYETESETANEVEALFPERADLSAMIVEVFRGYQAQEDSSSTIVTQAFGRFSEGPSRSVQFAEPTRGTVDLVFDLVAKVRSHSTDKAKDRVKAEKEAFLATVAGLSQEGGGYIVIHGAATPAANAFWDILKSFDSGLGVLHNQRLQQQNFFRIPLNLWVKFCERHFPETATALRAV